MSALAAPEVARLLHEFGQRTALRSGNPSRAKAYTRAAENLLALTEPLEELVAHGREALFLDYGPAREAYGFLGPYPPREAAVLTELKTARN